MTPHRLTARMRCQFSSGRKLLLSGPMPALFIRISVPPNRFCTAASRPATSSKRLTSTAAVMTSAAPPFATDASCCGGFGEAVGADIGDADLHAEAGKARRGGKPDAGRASGDDGNIVRRHGGMGQSSSPDRSRSPHFTGLFATRHRSHARAEPRRQEQGAGRKVAYLAISQTVAGTRAPRRASLADTPFHQRLERGAVAVQLDTHPVGELDPVLKMLARYRDHHRNVGAERVRSGRRDPCRRAPAFRSG